MKLEVGNITLVKKARKKNRVAMKFRIFYFGLIFIISGCMPYKFEESLNDINSNKDVVIAGKITAAINQEQQNELLKNSKALLNSEIGEKEAVELMLSKSPSFQSLLFKYRGSGSAAAQKARISNPVFSFERMVKGSEIEYGRFLSFGLLDLLSLPTKQKSSKLAVDLNDINFASEVYGAINDVRMSWFEAVASEQQLTLYNDAFIALSANAELAKRMKKTGNMTTSDRIRQQLIYSEATVALSKAKMRIISSRENLIRKIGLTESEANKLTIPKKLPELPNAPISIKKIAKKISERFDVKIARIEYELLLEQLGVEKINSYTDIEFGYRNDSIKDDGLISNKKGYELEIKIPIFDWGNLQRDTIQADLIAKQKNYENIVLAAASEFREAYQKYRTAFDIAKHYYNQIIPMHETLLEEATYNYNGMIIGVFELMQSGLEKSTAEIKAIDALQNLFAAELNLNSVSVGRKLGAKSRTTEIASKKAKKGH